MTLEIFLALAVLMLVCIGTYFVAGRLRVPYTVLLVVVGTLLVPLTRIPWLHFLKSFQLTPELLFFVFLPVLIFESAYNMNVREMTENLQSISWLAVASLLISALFAAAGIKLCLGLIGFEVPFIVTLIFGALISATDPVAVLALFKEYGAPKRLSLIFEGESLFNDGTSLALFLIVLEVAIKGYGGAGTVVEGVLVFLTMVAGGFVFGVLMGLLFANVIGWVRENEHVEITLTMLVAHLTFILSELIGSHLAVFGHRIRLSSIIATVVASMVIGNYGRPKISPGVERYMERFWGYFAFIANSLVFILMGLLFADLPIHFGQFVVPIAVTVAVVIVGRGLSIYPVVWLVNRTRREEHIPASWQHLLAWGSLRGALAMTMVLLIPDDLRVPGWDYGFTVKEFIAALTIGCIYFTLVVKATTIGTLIRRMRLSELTPLESIAYHESRALIYARALERLEEFREQGSMKDEVWQRLRAEYADRYQRAYADCHACFGTVPGDAGRALQAYALGMERRLLRELFVSREIDEADYKEILNKIQVQLARVERGREQIAAASERFAKDWFERLVDWLRERIRPATPQEQLRRSYRYYRAQEIILGRVVGRLRSLVERLPGLFGDQAVVARAIGLYETLHTDARERREAAGGRLGEQLAVLDGVFGRTALLKAEELALQELLEDELLPRKISVLLSRDLERAAEQAAT